MFISVQANPHVYLKYVCDEKVFRNISTLDLSNLARV